MNKNLSSVIDWDKDINIGDKHVDGSQLRPHIVLFGEMPYYVDKAYKDIRETDYLIIIGTSLEISYTIELLGNVNDHCRIIYIDPNPAMYLSNKGLKVEYVREKASVGVVKVVNELLND
jgi:NAD-dependent deacetylase